MFDLIFLSLIVAVGFNFKNTLKSELKLRDLKILNILFIYHLLFGIIYWAYISFISSGDAVMYYFTSNSLSFSELISIFIQNGPGSSGMFILTSFPAKYLSFFTVSLLYSLVGYFGVIYFYAIFVNNIKYNTRIYNYYLMPFLFFLPNLHFWSAGLGKDTISFFCIGMFIYSMQKPSKNILKILLALGLTYLIRPHITIFLITSFGIAYMLDGKLKLYQKVFFTSIFLVSFILLFDKFMSFVNIESLDAESIQAYGDKKAGALNRSSGSGVDISSYPYPLKVLTFLYRPFFFDINSVLAIVASFENLILLILSIKFIKTNPITMWKKSNYLFKGMLVFFLIGALSFSLILGNLGIMLREKNMFIPAFFFVCLWAFSTQQQEKLKKFKNKLA